MHVTWTTKQLIKCCIIRRKVTENKTTKDERKKIKFQFDLRKLKYLIIKVNSKPIRKFWPALESCTHEN